MCFSDDCPDNDKAAFTAEETLDHAFQPPDGDILHRQRFVPTNVGPFQRPTVLMLPPDVWKLEYDDKGVPSELWATHDLQQAGFLVFQIEHRLAPDGQLPGQTSSGHAPDQTDDVKRQILAALADPECNGSIYLIGGSAGGCLALWCALDPASTVAGWDEDARAHIKAVVSLSGPTQLCDWGNYGGIPDSELTRFEDVADNYVGLPDQVNCDPTCDLTAVDCPLDQASPAWLVTHGATNNPPPIRLYATDGDSVPFQQANDMFQALFTRYNTTIDYMKYIMHYQYTDRNHHAYTYWHSTNNADNSDGQCVSQQVIEFLQAHP